MLKKTSYFKLVDERVLKAEYISTGRTLTGNTIWQLIPGSIVLVTDEKEIEEAFGKMQ